MTNEFLCEALSLNTIRHLPEDLLHLQASFYTLSIKPLVQINEILAVQENFIY